MKVVPYIFVEECEKAMEFYKDIFGGEITQIQKAEGTDKLLHARLEFNNYYALYFSDIFEDVNFGNNTTIVFEFDSEEAIKKAYEKLSVGGTVKMELQKAFWGSTFAMVTDKYKVVWQLTYNSN